MGDDLFTGSDFTNPFATLQKALESATVAGTKIYIARGTYKPSQQYNFTTGATSTGDLRAASFKIPEGVEIYGGFDGSENERNFSQAQLDARDLVANQTILSGDIGTTNDNTDNVYHVVYTKGVSTATKLDGVTIVKGNATGTGANINGAGWFNDGSGIGNTSNPTVVNCIFSENNASFGGGMYNYSFGGTANPTLTNCVFSKNNATNSGGGLYNNGGGGVSSPTLTNCTFSLNTTTNDGGGIYNNGTNSGSSNPIIRNSIFWGNTAGNGASWFNGSANVAYTLIQETTLPTATTDNGNNKLNQDPLFVDAANGNVRLQAGSPAIDAGNNANITGVVRDVAGKPRIFQSTVDMGAHEAQGLPEINLRGNGVDIASGTTATSTTNNTNFGQSVGTPISKTFIIQNTGAGVLNITNITSSNTTFVVSNSPSNVTISGQAEFTLTFTPTVSGLQTSTITINNNDADEAAYTFNVAAEGICPTTANVSVLTSPILSNEASSIVVESKLGVTYQLQNVDNANANVGSTVAGTGETIFLPTGQLTTTTQFRVQTTGSLNCGTATLNTVTVTVSGTNGYGYRQTQTNVCNPANTLAAIDVSLTGTSYNWNNGTMTQDLTNVADGLYSLNIDNGTTVLPVIVGTPIEWENIVRATTSEGRIIANGSYNWNSNEAAATSKAKLGNGENGGFTFLVEDLTTIANTSIGLTPPNTSSSYLSMDNSFYIYPNGDLFVYLNDIYFFFQIPNVTVAVGDRLTMTREGTSIKYYYNSTLVYEDIEAKNATDELVVDIALVTGTSPKVWFSKCTTDKFEVKYVQNSEDACNTTATEGSITLLPQMGSVSSLYLFVA